VSIAIEHFEAYILIRIT